MTNTSRGELIYGGQLNGQPHAMSAFFLISLLTAGDGHGQLHSWINCLLTFLPLSCVCSYRSAKSWNSG